MYYERFRKYQNILYGKDQTLNYNAMKSVIAGAPSKTKATRTNKVTDNTDNAPDNLEDQYDYIDY